MPSNLPTTPNDELASTYGLDSFPGVDFGKGIRDRPGLRPQPPVSGRSHLPGDAAASAEDTLTEALQIAANMDEGDFVPKEFLEPSLPSLRITLANEAPQLPQDIVGRPQALLDIDMSNESTAFEIQANDVGLRDGQGIVHHEWLQAGQDPARLPLSNHDSLSELEGLWGGITTGREVRAGALKELLGVAMRRSAQGESITGIQAKLEATSQASWPKVKQAFEQIEAEHGLHGPLYLRASAFPGLHRGKHAQLLRRLSGRARYLIGGDAEAATALGLRRVAHAKEIPWDKELARVAPRSASQGEPREQLRRAFLTKSEVRVVHTSFQTARPRPQTPAPLPKAGVSKDARELQRKWVEVGKLADRLVRVGKITLARVQEMGRPASPEEYQRALMLEAMKPKATQNFQGSIQKAAPVVEIPKVAKMPIEELLATRARHQERQRVEQFVGKLARQGAIPEGQLEGMRRLASIQEVQAAVRALSPTKVVPYSGGWRLDAESRQKAADVHKMEAQAAEVKALARKQMVDRLRAKVARLQKGAQRGEDLDLLIPRLFSEVEKHAAQKAIDWIRAQALPATPLETANYQGKVYTAHQSVPTTLSRRTRSTASQP